GYFCRSLADNKYYVVAGHNHASVVEVSSIDKFKRVSGEITVTPDDIRKATEWDLEQQQKAAYTRACVIDCFPSKREVRIDGSPDDWEAATAAVASAALFADEPDTPVDDAKLNITFDDKYLYLCFDTRGMGPMRNSGEQWDRMFKTGASVDIQMGLEPDADAARKAPAPGDFRLLMTMSRGEPMAVIYKPVAPGAPDDKAWDCVSPVSKIKYDYVAKVPEVRIACRTGDDHYCLEAAVPLKTLGLRINDGLRLKFDWGMLVSGRDGNEVMRRVYWSNKATSIIADAPSEARLHPDLWGTIRFHSKDEKGLNVLDMANPAAEEKLDKGTEDFLEDLEDDLK
ncbi:MAG TPA: hypothetical protein VM223_24460, partial [Planctomycetota bacterium]|nr:hypothetical protein [Planctomycetota bacterium]